MKSNGDGNEIGEEKRESHKIPTRTSSLITRCRLLSSLYFSTEKIRKIGLGSQIQRQTDELFTKIRVLKFLSFVIGMKASAYAKLTFSTGLHFSPWCECDDSIVEARTLLDVDGSGRRDGFSTRRKTRKLSSHHVLHDSELKSNFSHARSFDGHGPPGKKRPNTR
jgi:hypothetical protein